MIIRVLEVGDIMEYLASRNILQQYQKAKQYLLDGNMGPVGFKKRKPLRDNTYEFRITQKYRARCYFKNSFLIVFEINDHQ